MKNIPIRKIKTPGKAPLAFQRFSIRNVRDLLDGKDMVQDVHRHDFFYVLALKKGKGKHTIDFTSYNVSDNSVFVMRPGQVHQLTLKAGSDGYLMEFKNDFYYPYDKPSYPLLRQVSNKNYCQLNASTSKKIFVILSHIFQEHTNQQEGYQDVIKASLDIFFIELIRHRKNRNGSLNGVKAYAQAQIDKFLEHLETYVYTKKQVSQYADIMNLSVFQLNAITKTTLGKTCSALIDEYIILESKRYLLATPDQVNQIAFHLGYEDVSYFIRFFKKHTGYTPEAFRNNFR